MSTMVRARPHMGVIAPSTHVSHRESIRISPSPVTSTCTSTSAKTSTETSAYKSNPTSTPTSTSIETSTTTISTSTSNSQPSETIDPHTKQLQKTRVSWAKTHQSWQEYITVFESMGFDGIGIFGLDAQLWAKSCSAYAKTIPSTPTLTTTSTTSTSTPTTTTTWDSRLFGHSGEPLNIQLNPKDWHIHTDEVRAIICGLSNTKTIGLQISSEEEQKAIAAQREACADHMIPDLVGFVVEYLKEGPTFGEALGSSGVLINGQMYRFIRGEPLDYIVCLKGGECVVIYRTHQSIIIGTSKGTDTFTGNHRLRDLTYRMGQIIDTLKRQGY